MKQLADQNRSFAPTRRTILTVAAGSMFSLPLVTGSARAQTTDREQWRFETGEMVFSSPTVVDGTVFFSEWRPYSLRSRC